MKLQIALATLLSTISQVKAQYDASIPDPVCAKFKTIKVEGNAEFVDTDNSVVGGVFTPTNPTTGDMTISIDLTGTAAVGSYPTQTTFRNISLDMSAICVITQDQSPIPTAPTCFWEADLGFCRSWILLDAAIEKVRLADIVDGGGRRTQYLRESSKETFGEEFVEATKVTKELIIANPELENICPQLGCYIRLCRDQRNGGFTAHGTGPDKFEITGGTEGLFGAFGQFEGQFAFPTFFDNTTGDINLDIDVDLEICYYKRENIF